MGFIPPLLILAFIYYICLFRKFTRDGKIEIDNKNECPKCLTNAYTEK